MTRSAWKGSNGEIGLVPKDDGAGVMVSAFNSRETGFGLMQRWPELKDKVNERRHKTKYIDTEAALEVHSTEWKRDLEENPLVRFLGMAQLKRDIGIRGT